ncbi:MAG: nucleotidyltransferase family protein [Rhodocyclaceae bacterium]
MRRELVTAALVGPQTLPELSPGQWDRLIRQARAARMLGRLAVTIERAQLLDRVPEAPRRHLQAARLLADQQRIAAEREVLLIRDALARTGVPIVLLKGAAYAMAGLPVAEGRMFGDIDILVPRAALADVESALMLAGWASIHRDAYDQRYYRQWMHEIPPMRHLHRGTVIDVHHALVPPTARIRAHSERMRSACVPLERLAGLSVLSPGDMVLHSATHLFMEGELDAGLRDLADIDGLLRHFGRDPGFWPRLGDRAREVGLSRPLHYALRYAVAMLQTSVPRELMRRAREGSPPAALRPLMDFCFLRALRPGHESCADAATPAARWLLYVRGHWLRMPAHLLLVHLARKAFKRDGAEVDGAADRH